MLKHTHLQPAVAGAPAAAASRTSQWMEIIRHVQAGSGSGTTARVGALWTGVGATLARDVPFSALYWALLEPVRSFLLPTPQLRSSASMQSTSQPAPTSGLTYRPHPSVALPAESADESRIVSLSAEDASGTPEHAASRSCDQQASVSGRADRQWATQQQGAHVGVPHSEGPPSASSHDDSQPHSGPAESSSDWRGHSGDSRGTHWQSQSHPSQHGRAFEGHDQHSRDHLQQESRAAAASGLEDMKAAGLKDRGDVQVGILRVRFTKVDGDKMRRKWRFQTVKSAFKSNEMRRGPGSSTSRHRIDPPKLEACGPHVQGNITSSMTVWASCCSRQGLARAVMTSAVQQMVRVPAACFLAILPNSQGSPYCKVHVIVQVMVQIRAQLARIQQGHCLLTPLRLYGTPRTATSVSCTLTVGREQSGLP